ncbi:hypothetical protein SAMN04489729_5510 [Amycolatopsis lurida]|nr:hypothetical protein [Amycolatopsis lurida]SED85732.1 hypothetical protein SAMN04489729_5510 [Amycolatopsis lurida]
MSNHDSDMSIVAQLRSINRETGMFVSGVLYDTITESDQIRFATKLADLALAIKNRVESGTHNLVLEGTVSDDGLAASDDVPPSAS